MSASSTDRNMLLGFLAVRVDLITEQALAASTADWERDRSRSLGQLLVARGHLRADEIPLLEKLVETHLQRQSQGSLPEGTLFTMGIAPQTNPPNPAGPVQGTLDDCTAAPAQAPSATRGPDGFPKDPVRNSKSERRHAVPFEIRISSFGFRVSDFGSSPSRRSAPTTSTMPKAVNASSWKRK